MPFARHEASSVAMVEDGCDIVAEADGHFQLRIASIFIILAASAIGAIIPICLARKSKSSRIQELIFSICKYTGTGVIIATAWLHLLVPAAAELSDPCLEPRLGAYPWAFAIALWTVMAMFSVEILANKFTMSSSASSAEPSTFPTCTIKESAEDDSRTTSSGKTQGPLVTEIDVERLATASEKSTIREPDDTDVAHCSCASQMLALLILEFGAIFHSFFVGLTLGTTRQLVLLLIVLVVHQLFEGLALGARLADAPWPANRRFLRYVFVALFAIATPIGTVVGMTAQPGSAVAQKLLGGVFSAVSAGILSYTGMVELLAGEFLFSQEMVEASTSKFAVAFISVLGGMVAMSVLAVWA
uniref:Zinc/iron permease n=2 Tax=Bionectria ochroleuca TaxID=29856 RepID=A0A0B7JJ73_BIOOC